MDIRRALISAAILCACHDCAAWAQTADVRIDLTPAALVLAPVELNGAPARLFVIDTGATTTMLDAQFATALALAPTGRIRVVTSGAAFSAASGRVTDVRIGRASLGHLPVSWTPLDRLRSEDGRITGVIGQDVLSRNTMTIDYARRQLRLDTGPCAAGDSTVHVERADGRPMVAARVQGVGGPRDVRLVIDSGANALVLFDRAGARRMSRPGGIRLATHAGDTPGAVIPRATLTVAGLSIHGPAVVVPPGEPRHEDGLLPAAWFSRVCVEGPRATAVLTR
jgi:predicted aspartyl protease